MAFTAIYSGEERGAWRVPKTETAYCTDCGEKMYIESQSKNGRARHFNHYPDRNGSGSGGGGGCGGGESDEHKKWKNFAAERLNEVFSDRAAARASVEETLAAPHSDKEDRDADACVFFEDWDEQFGRGLAVEVQHKNKDKDKEAVQKDYAGQDVAVVWLTGDDFHDDGLRFGEVDFRHYARQQTSICENLDCFIKLSPGPLPPRYHFDKPATLASEHINYAHDPRCANYNVQATIIADWILPTTAEYWRDHDWDAAFRSPNGEYGEREHRAQAAIPERPSTLTVEATVPHDWYWPTTAEYWREHGWDAALRQEQTEHALDAYRDNATVSIGCTLLPTVVDTLVYERLDMSSLPESPPQKTGRGDATEIPATLTPELAERLPELGKYTCRNCIWVGNEYYVQNDGSLGGTAVCPECGSGIRLTINKPSA